MRKYFNKKEQAVCWVGQIPKSMQYQAIDLESGFAKAKHKVRQLDPVCSDRSDSFWSELQSSTASMLFQTLQKYLMALRKDIDTLQAESCYGRHRN